MSALMSPAEMVVPVKTGLMSTSVNVDLVTKVVNVKAKLMNASPTLVNMEEPATDILIPTRVHVPKDSLEEIVKRTSTIAS